MDDARKSGRLRTSEKSPPPIKETANSTDCQYRLFKNPRNQLKVCNNLRTFIQGMMGSLMKTASLELFSLALVLCSCPSYFLKNDIHFPSIWWSKMEPVLLESLTCLMVPCKTQRERHIYIPPDSEISRVKILSGGGGHAKYRYRHALKKFKREGKKWDKGTEILKRSYFPGPGACWSWPWTLSAALLVWRLWASSPWRLRQSSNYPPQLGRHGRPPAHTQRPSVHTDLRFLSI